MFVDGKAFAVGHCAKLEPVNRGSEGHPPVILMRPERTGKTEGCFVEAV
jgi:hypothetical protein